ncbi:MAG TPA: Ig-like domain-containing protein [Chthoniobacterales bacterium]|jgi:hypothetical protein
MRSAAIIGLLGTSVAALAQNPVTISSTRLQSDFNGALGAGESAPIAASAFDFSGQAKLTSIQSVSITVTVIDGDTGLGPNGINETPYPPDGEQYGDDDFDVNSLGLRLDGVDLGQNLLLNGFTSFEEPFGAEDYVTRTISGAPANVPALLNALQDNTLVATVYDSTGVSQSNGLRIPKSNFAGNQQIFVMLAITGTPASGMPNVAITTPGPGQIIAGTTADFTAVASDDVGIVKVEFFIDGVLRYTDANSGNQTQFHYGGAPAHFDTTPFTNGPHALLARAMDTSGQTAEQQVQVLIGNGCAAWMAQHFAANDPNSGSLSDADRDGLTNLFEYATDSDPHLADVSRQPLPKFVTQNNKTYLALQFVVAKWATDLVYRVEASSSPTGNWTQIDPASAATLVSVQDDVPAFGLKTLTVRDVVSRDANPRFLRLRITKQ